MKLDLKFWLIIGLTVVIVYLLLTQRKPGENSAITLARDSIRRIQEVDRVHSMQVRTLALNLLDALSKSKVDSARFVRVITLKDQQLATKRVRIDTVFKDNPVLQDYLVTADSVFSMMHTRIDTLEAEKKFQKGLYDQMIYIKDKQLSNLQMVSGQKDIVIKDLEKQARRKSRGNKLVKAVAVIGTIGGFLFGTAL